MSLGWRFLAGLVVECGVPLSHWWVTLSCGAVTQSRAVNELQGMLFL